MLLAACSSPSAETARETRLSEGLAGSTAAPVRIVGWLDRQPVTYGNVGLYLRSKDPEAFARGLEGVLFERVVRAEATELGITVERALVQRQTTRRLAEWEASLRAAGREQTGQDVDPGEWLRRVAGMTRAEFRAHLSRHTKLELLEDRLLRYELLRAERVEVSILVVRERKQADELRERLRGGADFAELARQDSSHTTAKQGGRIAFPLLKQDLNESNVAAALFSIPEGAVGGPFHTSTPEGDYYQIYRLERRLPAESGPYAVVAKQIERALEVRPVVVEEYERWRRRVLLRHGYQPAPPPTPGSAVN